MNDASWTHSCTELSLGCLLKIDGPTPYGSIYDVPAPELPCQPNTVQKLRTSQFEMCNTSMHASRVCKKTLGSAPGKSTTFQFIQILASRHYITLLEQCNDNVATEDVSRSNLLSATCHTCQQYKEHD
jgi:hypothetical protein